VESSSRPPHPPRCSPRPTPTRRGRCRGGQQPPIMSDAEQTASARTPAQHERCRAGAACQRPPPASFSHLPRAGLEQVDPGLGPPDPGQGGADLAYPATLLIAGRPLPLLWICGRERWERSSRGGEGVRIGQAFWLHRRWPPPPRPMAAATAGEEGAGVLFGGRRWSPSRRLGRETTEGTPL
jgi:hypothetical protein